MYEWHWKDEQRRGMSIRKRALSSEWAADAFWKYLMLLLLMYFQMSSLLSATARNNLNSRWQENEEKEGDVKSSGSLFGVWKQSFSENDFVLLANTKECESIGAMCWLTGEHLKGLLCGGAPALLLLLLLRKFCPIAPVWSPLLTLHFDRQQHEGWAQMKTVVISRFVRTSDLTSSPYLSHLIWDWWPVQGNISIRQLLIWHVYEPYSTNRWIKLQFFGNFLPLYWIFGFESWCIATSRLPNRGRCPHN